ncbi:MAG: zinc ABC transporter substrate-binding protein [Rhodospirillaceae bacterium]
MRQRFPLLLALFLFGFSGVAGAVPKVVVSIKPLHSLAARVMGGVGQPALLVNGAASPHTYSLRPSDMRMIEDAAVVFWIGPNFETFLTQALTATHGVAVTLSAAPGMMRLKARAGGLWDSSAQTKDAGDDPHLWLDIANAKAIAQAMAAALGAADPANAVRYASNARSLAVDLDAFDGELRGLLMPVRDRRFIVFHDATRYFEERYGLMGVGAVTIGPERPPGARRVEDLRARLAEGDVACLFTEPQFEPKLASTLVGRSKVKTGTLDPEGTALTPGPALYFDLMRGLARGFAGCLGHGQ